MANFFLYLTTVIVWGSSWLGVKYQLGVVDPGASLVYRFAFSAAIMVAICVVTGRSLRFNRRQHGQMALQGLLLFCLNYSLIYSGTQYLTSGLVAVAFSTVSVNVPASFRKTRETGTVPAAPVSRKSRSPSLS